MTVALRLHSLVFGICRVTARPQLQADHGDPYALEPSNNLATSVRELLASFRDPTDGSITPAGRDFAYQHGNDAFNQVVIAASNKCTYSKLRLGSYLDTWTLAIISSDRLRK
eukprot:GHVT01032784.1.p2 GENE.GHVT01032784.1~~GHVT01032784.1.p2  ORF type:complete len:112 (-),score=3.19 GHVT01032784.1:851-1186(-)